MGKYFICRNAGSDTIYNLSIKGSSSASVPMVNHLSWATPSFFLSLSMNVSLCPTNTRGLLLVSKKLNELFFLSKVYLRSLCMNWSTFISLYSCFSTLLPCFIFRERNFFISLNTEWWMIGYELLTFLSNSSSLLPCSRRLSQRVEVAPNLFDSLNALLFDKIFSRFVTQVVEILFVMLTLNKNKLYLLVKYFLHKSIVYVCKQTDKKCKQW